MLLKIDLIALIMLSVFTFVMDNRHKKTEETFDDTLYVSLSYLNSLHLCALISTITLIVICFVKKFQMVTPFFLLFTVLTLTCEFTIIGMKRNVVKITDEALLVTPFIGKTKEISYVEITGCEEKRNIGIKLYVGDKKAATISCDMVGYPEFVKLLKEKEILDSDIEPVTESTKE